MMICPQCRNEDVRYSAAASQISCAKCGYYGIPLRTGEKRPKPKKAKAAEKREPKKKVKKAAYNVHLRRRKKFRR